MIDIANISHAQRQRLQFIESVAYWEGLVGRSRVCKVFDVTENHITKDFRLYRETFPGNLDYDISSRVYRPGKAFKPRISSGSAEEYLALLRTYLETRSAAVISTIGEGVDAICLPAPTAPLDKKVLREITRALHQQRGVKIDYQSLTSSEASTRDFWPHALVFASTRWHVRGHDSRRNMFVDLVLHRVLSARALNEPSPVSVDEDVDWHETVEVDVTPSKSLNAEQQAVVAKEFGMTKIGSRWVWRVPMKRCLVSYFLRWMRLDLPSEGSYPIALADPGLAKVFRFDGL